MNLQGVLRWMGKLGVATGGWNMAAIALGGAEYKLRVPGIPGRIVARENLSDIPMFDQVFIQRQYDVKVDFEPKVIVDAGANAGYATLFFKQRFPEARIIAIEPDESNCELFMRNTSRLRDVQLLRGGLWGESRSLKIANPNASKCTLTLEPAPSGAPSLRGYTVSEVMEVAKAGFIDILKIDIEGSEIEVFSANIGGWLPRVRMLIVELHDRMRKGCAMTFYKALAGRNFSQEQQGDSLVIINEDFKGPPQG